MAIARGNRRRRPGGRARYVLHHLPGTRCGHHRNSCRRLLKVGQQIGEPPMRSMRTRLDGSDGDSQPFRRLLMREPQKVGRLDDVAVFGWHLVDGGSDFPGLPCLFEGAGKYGHLTVVVCFRSVEGDPTLVTLLTPVHIDRGASGDRIEPWSGVSLDIEPVGCLPRLKEGELHRFLGQAPIAERRVRHGVDGPSVLVVELCDGMWVSGRETLEDSTSDASCPLFDRALLNRAAGPCCWTMLPG